MTVTRSNDQDDPIMRPEAPGRKSAAAPGALQQDLGVTGALDGGTRNGAAYSVGGVAEAAERPIGVAVTGQPSPFHAVAADLSAVEAAILDTAAVDNSLLQQTLRLILSAGGKRLRPALVLLAAGLHPNTLERRVALAVAAELLHTATLVHDDVLDLADARPVSSSPRWAVHRSWGSSPGP
jgi:hypothetical protein